MKYLSLILLTILLIVGFVTFTGFVLTEQRLDIDSQMIVFINHNRSSAMTSAMKTITFFGSHFFLIPAYLLLIVYYIYKKKNKSAVNVLAIGLSGTVLLFILKEIFRRPRPLVTHLAEAGGFSYPSGHSFSSFLFFGLCAYLIYRRGTTGRKFFYILIVSGFPLVIGFSRIYLGVHYLSDVIAGFILGALWLSGALIIIQNMRKGREGDTAG